MGQRHQMFLVARLSPKQPRSDNRAFYRCIGAYHLQWCYGILAVKKTARFLSLLKNEYNAGIVKDEIRRAQFQYGRHEGAPIMPDLPCPYTMLLLAAAVDNNISSVLQESSIGLSFGNSTLSPNMGPWDGDNNDGITVIDVTDPADPAICMLSGDNPLSPGEYAAGYGDVKGADILDGVRLVTREILSEVWPSAYKPKEGKDDEAGEAEAEAFDLSTLAQEVPHLSDLVLRPAVEIASQSGDTSQLEDIVWMPGKAESFKQVLRTQNPFLDESLGLLIKILQHEVEAKSFVQLDLSGLHLSTDQVVTIVSNPDIVNSRPLAVNLSGNSILSSATVSAVLSAFPKLLRLTMLDTGLENDSLFELLSSSPKLFHELSDLVHPALLLAPPNQKRDQYVHPHTFTLVTRCQTHTIASASVPFFNLEKLMNSLIQSMHLIHIQDSSLAMQSTWIPLLAMSIGVRVMRDEEVHYPLVSQDWEQRAVSCVPQVRTNDYLEGEGWIFVSDWTMFSRTNAYGFVRVNKEALARAKEQLQKTEGDASQAQAPRTIPNTADLWHIYDVRGFVSELEKEGRTLPANIEQLLTQFEEALVELSKKKYGPDSPWSLVTYQDLPKFKETIMRQFW